MGSEPLDNLSNWVDGVPQTIRAVLAADKRLVVSIVEAAEMLGISTSTVRVYTKKGWLHAPDTYGGRVLVTKASIAEFLTAGPPAPRPEPVSPKPSVPQPPARSRSKGFNLDALRRPTRGGKKTT